MVERLPSSQKSVIKIVVPEDLKVEFKKISVELGGYKKTIEKFVKAYKCYPSMFKDLV